MVFLMLTEAVVHLARAQLQGHPFFCVEAN